ncbi:MAG TPA: methyltransferase domain-containing protein, partial [Candidatus Polarisedimenticolia bacterium]|nr:methyltransferase domain-containing protein [Candidatus Polarisedimenticolia bacterium]
MIEAKVSADLLRRVYDKTSRFYGASASVFDRKARQLGLERARIIAGDRVLEVGCGPGITLDAIAGRTVATGFVVGVDSSCRMLGIAHQRLDSAGGRRASLVQADGTRLPFRDCSFDV